MTLGIASHSKSYLIRTLCFERWDEPNWNRPCTWWQAVLLFEWLSAWEKSATTKKVSFYFLRIVKVSRWSNYSNDFFLAGPPKKHFQSSSIACCIWTLQVQTVVAAVVVAYVDRLKKIYTKTSRCGLELLKEFVFSKQLLFYAPEAGLNKNHTC